MSIKDNFQEIKKKRNNAAYKRKIAEEINYDMEKYFINEGNLRTNQQEIGMREVLRGFVAKEWVSLPHEIIYYWQDNKVLVVKGENLNSECWKNIYDIE